jgi:amino acid transporter
MTAYQESPSGPAVEVGAVAAPKKLRGNLGVISIVFTVLAFNAPVAVAAGFVPLVVGFGNQSGAPSTFVVTGVILALFSVGLTAMSRFMRSPGAFYSYIVTGLGRVPGLSGAFTAIAAYAAFGITMTVYGGIVFQSLVQNTFHGPSVPWWVWGLLLWAVAATFSLRHIDLSAKVLGVALCLEVGIVALWALMVFAKGGAHGISAEPFTPHAFLSGSVSLGMLFGVLCVTGFEAVAVFREETKDPVKTVPRATYASVVFMCGFYALVAWAYITAFGPHEAVVQATANPSGSFTQSVHAYVGIFAEDIVSVLLVTSSFACLLATMNIGARYFYTLGSDKVLPGALGKVHHRQESPHIAASTFAAIVVIGALVPAIGRLNPVTTYAATSAIGALCLLLLYSCTSVAVVSFFRRDRSHTANLWQSTVAPILGLGGLVTIVVLAIVNMPGIMGGTRLAANMALAVIAFIIAAGAALALYYRRKRPAVYKRIGQQDL